MNETLSPTLLAPTSETSSALRLLVVRHEGDDVWELPSWSHRCRIETAGPDDVLALEGEALPAFLLAFDAVMFVWSREAGRRLSGLAHAARRAARPLFALCPPQSVTHVAALVLGADAVLTPPFSLALIEARLLAYHRSATPVPFPVPPPSCEPSRTPTSIDTGHDVLRAGRLLLDRTARKFFVDRHPMELSFIEFNLMAHLMEHTGRCLERDAILLAVWGLDFDTGTNILDARIYALRRKLKPFALDRSIVTVRGVGYRLEPDACALEFTAEAQRD